MKYLAGFLMLLLVSQSHAQQDSLEFYKISIGGTEDSVLMVSFKQRNSDSIAWLPEVFKYKHFDSPMPLARIDFQDKMNFTSSIFKEGVEFWGSVFKQGVNFLGTEFHSKATFGIAHFKEAVTFGGTKFKSDNDFGSTRFHKESVFNASEFDNSAEFTKAHFLGRSSFEPTIFRSDATFSSAKFNSMVSFNGSVFSKRADFSLTEFGDEARFEGTTFEGEARFYWSILPHYLSFEGVRTSEIIDLTNAKLSDMLSASGEKCKINLIDAPIDRFKLRYDKFRVYKPEVIDREVFEKLTNVYEGLLKNFKDNGYLTSHAILDREYHDFKYTQNPDGHFFGAVLNFVNRHWSNYGHEKSRILLFTLGFFSLFTLFNWLRLPKLVDDVYTVPTVKKELDERNSDRSELNRGIPGLFYLNLRDFDQALFYTGIIFFGLKVGTENFNFSNLKGVFYVLLQYVVGLICVGYLANFVISSQLIGA